MIQHASDLRGFIVIARKEGAELGTLSAIRIDPIAKAVAGFEIRTRRVGGKLLFAPVSAVQVVGRDVIVVSEEAAVGELIEPAETNGRSLKELQGMWVTSMGGDHLGTLIDVDFAADDWRIRELVMDDGKHLSVDPDRIKIGDELLVPEEYAAQVETHDRPKAGWLARLLGREAVDDTQEDISRAEDEPKRATPYATAQRRQARR